MEFVELILFMKYVKFEYVWLMKFVLPNNLFCR